MEHDCALSKPLIIAVVYYSVFWRVKREITDRREALAML